MIRSISPASDDSRRSSRVSRFPLNAGSSTDGWRPLRRIAVTASSEIFLIQDPKGRRVVGKRLVPALAGRQRLIENEYRALTRFADPAVVRALGLSVQASDTWLLLEYLNYGDLRSLAGAPPAYWLPLLLEPVRWLADLHAQGFVHGDIKTSHVMLRHPRQACCVDLATVTASGQRQPAQTMAAAPPEGLAVALPSTDVFALGVMLHELLFARLPAAGDPVRHPRVGGCPHLAMLEAACRAPEPANRPTMQTVLRQLTELSDRAARVAS